MTFPPVIERELRVAARGRGIYWTRFFVALAATGVGCGVYGLNRHASSEIAGPKIFTGLAVLGFIYALLAGRLFTADCLSSEKREGTLGLLFLTDLKGRDIVLGKMAATSLSGFLGLLALFPIMAVPMLMGGISYGQFWRVVFVLLNTFLFSLAVGIYCSAVSRDYRRAAGLTIGWILGLALLLPLAVVLLGGPFSYSRGAPPYLLVYPSPTFSFVTAFDGPYGSRGTGLADAFWTSCVVVHGLTWLFVLRASNIVPRSWQDQPQLKPEVIPLDAWRTPTVVDKEARDVYRKHLLGMNAYYWLAAQNRFKPLHVWTFLGFMALWWLACHEAMGEWINASAEILLVLLLNVTLKLWVCIEAGQRLAEDQKAGALELLMCTPLTAAKILRGQFLALSRQFLKPFVVVLATEIILAVHSYRLPLVEAGGGTTALFMALAMLSLPIDSVAVVFVALRQALMGRGPQRTTFDTFLKVLVTPWLVFGLVAAAIYSVAFSLRGEMPNMPMSALIWLWFGSGIVMDCWFGSRAWNELRTNFQALASERFETARGRDE